MPPETTPPTTSPQPVRGSVFCNDLWTEECLAAIKLAVDDAAITIEPGDALDVDYSTRGGWGPALPSYLVVAVPPGWNELTEFHVATVDLPVGNHPGRAMPWDPALLTRLPEFIADKLPSGGPWTGPYVADKLLVSFAAGTSPAEASVMTDLSLLVPGNPLTDQPPTGQTLFDIVDGSDASLAGERVAQYPFVCSADLLAFDVHYELTKHLPATGCPSWPSLVLQVNGRFVVTATSGIELRNRPSNDSRLLATLKLDSAGYIVAGPEQVGAVDWWRVEPTIQGDERLPLGWVAATSPAGQPRIEPAHSWCPPLGGPMTAGSLAMDGAERALACYDSQEWAFKAVVDCQMANVDYVIGGASWLASNFVCTADRELAIALPPEVAQDLFDGPVPVQLLGGVFDLRGHFGDQQSANCGSVPFGTTGAVPQPDPDAVWMCRQIFVATQFEPLSLGEIAGHQIRFQLYVPCATQAIQFAGARWVADSESYRGWQPTDTYSEEGSMEVISDSQVLYHSPNGTELLFNRLDSSSTQRCEI